MTQYRGVRFRAKPEPPRTNYAPKPNCDDLLPELLKTGDLSQNIVLRAGDLIHVPDDSAQRVYVMGEVNDPVRWQWARPDSH